MAKVAIVGDSESVKGFGAIGLDCYPVDEAEKAPSLLKQLIHNEEYAIVFITEALAAVSEKEIRSAEERMVPAVIPLPGVRDNTGLGVSRLRDAVERAVGSDIVFGG